MFYVGTRHIFGSPVTYESPICPGLPEDIGRHRRCYEVFKFKGFLYWCYIYIYIYPNIIEVELISNIYIHINMYQSFRRLEANGRWFRGNFELSWGSNHCLWQYVPEGNADCWIARCYQLGFSSFSTVWRSSSATENQACFINFSAC